jgi:hypothetical protein
MKKTVLIAWLIALPALLSASDVVALFMERYAEDNRPLNNVNIGKAMLERMAEETTDEELKKTFSMLNSIRIISSDSKRDSRHYFRKAVVSVNEENRRISVWLKEMSESEQDLILLSLDEEGKFTLINVTGQIDFDSISRLSGSLKNKAELMQQTK